MRTVQERVHVNLPEGMVSESVESRLLHSASGFSAPVSCGTIRPGWGAKMAEVTTALCAARQETLVTDGTRTIHLKSPLRWNFF